MKSKTVVYAWTEPVLELENNLILGLERNKTRKRD